MIHVLAIITAMPGMRDRMRLQRLDRGPLLDDDEGVGAETGEAGRAVANVDDRVVGETAVLGPHGVERCRARRRGFGRACPAWR